MAIFEQEESGLKHIAFLRKIIAGRRSGIASFKGRQWSSNIPFDHGVFLIGDNVVEMLCRIIKEPVLRFEWSESMQHDDDLAMPMMPRLAFTQTIASLYLPEDRLELYRQMFSKLPAIKVRMTNIFKFDLMYQKLFQELYSMTLAAEGIQLSIYFNAQVGDESWSKQNEGLRKRVNVAIALYCLGDLVPAIKRNDAEVISKPSTVIATGAKVNVVSRILMRLRGDR